MKGKWLPALLLAPLFATACDLLESNVADRIPGRYRMVTRAGTPLPAPISGGAEVVSGEMRLQRNFRWVLTQRVDSLGGGARRSVAVADSGTFHVASDTLLLLYTRDNAAHPVRVAGDTLDIFWGRAHHEVFVR